MPRPLEGSGDAAEAVAYAQRVGLPAVVESVIDYVVSRRAENPVEAIFHWCIERLHRDDRDGWARDKVVELLPPPPPPPPPEVEVEWAKPLRGWDFVAAMHDALCLRLRDAAEAVDDPAQREAACESFSAGLRLHGFLCRAERDVFGGMRGWTLHQLGESAASAVAWAERIRPLTDAGAAGAAVTARSARDMRAFAEAEERRLMRQDAVVEAAADELDGPDSTPLVAQILQTDLCEAQCHAVPTAVFTLCQRRPYDTARRFSAAMQVALSADGFKPFGGAVRRAAKKGSQAYARLLQGEGLLDVSIADVL